MLAISVILEVLAWHSGLGPVRRVAVIDLASMDASGGVMVLRSPE
jgi:hypothetical protein